MADPFKQVVALCAGHEIAHATHAVPLNQPDGQRRHRRIDRQAEWDRHRRLAARDEMPTQARRHTVIAPRRDEEPHRTVSADPPLPPPLRCHHREPQRRRRHGRYRRAAGRPYGARQPILAAEENDSAGERTAAPKRRPRTANWHTPKKSGRRGRSQRGRTHLRSASLVLHLHWQYMNRQLNTHLKEVWGCWRRQCHQRCRMPDSSPRVPSPAPASPEAYRRAGHWERDDAGSRRPSRDQAVRFPARR